MHCGAPHTEQGCRLFQRGSQQSWQKDSLGRSQLLQIRSLRDNGLSFLHQLLVDLSWSCHNHIVA
jgi:hypothetical protein